MLDLELKAEARAFQQYEFDGDDPEYVAEQWIDATMAEFLSVVNESGVPRTEWVEDTLSAHKWLRRRNARRCPACLVVTYIENGFVRDARTNTAHNCTI